MASASISGLPSATTLTNLFYPVLNMYVLGTCSDNYLRVWNITSGALVTSYSTAVTINSIAALSDGHTLGNEREIIFAKSHDPLFCRNSAGVWRKCTNVHLRNSEFLKT